MQQQWQSQQWRPQQPLWAPHPTPHLAIPQQQQSVPAAAVSASSSSQCQPQQPLHASAPHLAIPQHVVQQQQSPRPQQLQCQLVVLPVLLLVGVDEDEVKRAPLALCQQGLREGAACSSGSGLSVEGARQACWHSFFAVPLISTATQVHHYGAGCPTPPSLPACPSPTCRLSSAPPTISLTTPATPASTKYLQARGGL